MTLPPRRAFALMLTALLLLAANLRLVVTTASVLLPLLIDDGALTPQAAILVPAAQGVGYGISTIGPLGAGAWHSAGGDWAPVLVAMIGGAVLQGAIGLALASRPAKAH